jgi:hypothetical protein
MKELEGIVTRMELYLEARSSNDAGLQGLGILHDENDMILIEPSDGSQHMCYAAILREDAQV